MSGSFADRLYESLDLRKAYDRGWEDCNESWTKAANDLLARKRAEHNPTDPTTWTRAQLVAEVTTLHGHRSPDGWDRTRVGMSLDGWEMRSHDTMLTVNIRRRRNGYRWAHYHRGDMTSHGIAPTLTGPNGAFAQAEQAAGVSE